jgi:hypothetical protein
MKYTSTCKFVFLDSKCVDDPDGVLEASNGMTSDCAMVIGMITCNGDALDGSGRKVSDVCCGSCNSSAQIIIIFLGTHYVYRNISKLRQHEIFKFSPTFRIVIFLRSFWPTYPPL